MLSVAVQFGTDRERLQQPVRPDEGGQFPNAAEPLRALDVASREVRFRQRHLGGGVGDGGPRLCFWAHLPCLRLSLRTTDVSLVDAITGDTIREFGVRSRETMAKARTGADGSFYRHVGEQVRRLREGAGLKQEELAARVGLSRASIANVEAGKQAVPLHLFAAITEALGAELAHLLPSTSSPRGRGTKLRSDVPPVVRMFFEDVVAGT